MSHKSFYRSIFGSGNAKTAISALLGVYLLLPAAVAQADWKDDANARIESIRKRSAQITVIDQNSSPVAGLTAQIEQVRHLFAFGTCIAYSPLVNQPNYRNFILNHYEWAVCENEMKWSSNESTRDVWNYTQADYIADWCAENNITLRGHTLVWETGGQTPSWVSGLGCSTYPPTSEMMDEIDERINNTVGRYAGQIVQWDVDNEMLSGDMFDCLGEAGRAHFFQQANSRDPNCVFMMNEYSGNSFGGYDGDPYRNRAQGLINLGAPIETLGIQGHVSSPFRPEDYYNYVLNELDDLGLPIMVTEFDVDAANVTQRATDLENFYRICFSHPAVEGIIMWGFWDGSQWRDNAHLVETDWTINEAGLRYESLLDEWTTNDSNFSDVNGNVNFRGFHGDYEITLSAPGQAPEVHLIELEPGSTTAQFTLLTDLTTPEPDFNAPTPNPMTWAVVPTATGPSSITMTATTASDTSGVEYYFDCLTAGGHDSSWQDSTTYTDTGLTPSTSYIYRVQARDKSLNQNTTEWSSSLAATTQAPIIQLLGSWVSGTTHMQESGNSRALLFFVTVEKTSAITLNSVAYGGRTMTKIIERTADTSTQAYTSAFILNDANLALASNNTFVPSWSSTPAEHSYQSAFFSNVNQTNPVGPNDTNAVVGNVATLKTNPLATGNGDMVFVAATCGNKIDYTVNNGFTEAIENDMASSTGTAGYKSATGVNETPSVTASATVNRQSMIGFVLKTLLDFPPANPSGLIATAGNESVSLNWNDNTEPDLAGYNVYRSTTQGSGYVKLNSALLVNSDYIDSGLTNGITYYYVVTAVDDAEQESGYSNEASATPAYQNCDDVLAGGDRILSDLTGDCYVDYHDLGVIANQWLRTDCSPPGNCGGADFEPADGQVDFFDLSDFAPLWMSCNNPGDPDCTPGE